MQTSKNNILYLHFLPLLTPRCLSRITNHVIVHITVHLSMPVLCLLCVKLVWG